MKKRLFEILGLIMFAVFILSLVAFILVFKVNIKSNYIAIIALIAIFSIIILLAANTLSFRIINNSLSPVSSFLKYITDILLKDHYDENAVDIEIEKEVLAFLVAYGHNSKDVKEALSRVKRAQTLRKEFSANVTHELKSPLTSINGYAEMIAGGMTSLEESRKFAGIINEQGNRLLKMIDETIQLSKFDNNYVATERFTVFNLGDVIDETIHALEQFAKQKKVKINFQKDNIYYYGNQKLMEDLVRNLISNSIKYSKPCGGQMDIGIIDLGDKIEMVFADDGIGIDPSEHDRIFERFYVVNKSRSSKAGTGLGLSLVKNIAQMHHGHVDLESQLEMGSIFTVSLPKLSEEDYD
ncbi:MAG: HAMP domain-containing sensor histidine kinase [Tissierellia bacterium]|nr:HAMP domain-containing sensor histidine kinase [Tissierellia bacterium]